MQICLASNATEVRLMLKFEYIQIKRIFHYWYILLKRSHKEGCSGSTLSNWVESDFLSDY